MRFSYLLFLLPGYALAQPVDEIIVTGEFRPTRLDKVPASVSVLDAADIEATGARHLADILALAPNVNLAGGSSRSRFFQIRGIGERGQFAGVLNPSVGVLVDGVDLSDAATAATLFDVEQVEIFRGPQGTRYGANALAGLINVRTRQPGDRFEAHLGLDAGDYDMWTLNGALSGPLSDSVSLRVAAQQHSSDGFIHNTFLDRSDTNARDEQSVRAKLRWTPATDTTLDALVGYVDIDNGYDAFSLDNDRTTLSDEPGRDAQRTAYGALSLSWDGADAFTVEAAAAGASSDSTYGYDEDWAFEGFHPFGYSATDYYLRDRRNLTGEIKLLSKEPGRLFGGASDWVLGMYTLDREDDLHREYTFLAVPFQSTATVDRLALFGQLETALSQRTVLTTGLRYEHHESKYEDSEGLRFSPTDRMYGWRISLDRDLRESLMAYVSLSRGYKAGGFNTDGTLDADLRQYEPETLLNYEVGLKGEFFDRRLAARLTAFYMRRDKVQIASSLTRERGDGSTDFVQFIGNAAEGSNTGVEAEIAFQATDALQLQASLGLLESEYKSFINAAGQNLDGREQAHAPAYQFAVRTRYDFGSGWYGELGAEGRDAFFFSDSHDLRSRSYQVLNTAVGLSRDSWDVRLWARNLTDEDYFVRGYFFGNDPRIDYTERGYTQYGDPRLVGITTTWTFN
jgi:outer membrane receptor protein involved in Fe transport